MINSFQEEYRFLSNFYPSRIYCDGFMYETAEHFYQAHKTLDTEEFHAIVAAKTPGLAKRLGQTCTKKVMWDEIKYSIMNKVQYLKYTQNTDLLSKLKYTKNEYLEEGNTWHDTYWGVCYCDKCAGVGSNNLGKILMNVRGTL
jgi:ribA/ribD-fused uncharacterized protein